MKIEIDLSDVLRDEYGEPGETVKQSISRQVVEKIAEDARTATKNAVDDAISRSIIDVINTTLNDRLPILFENLLDYEYTPVGRYGEESGPTTIRKELHAKLTEIARFESRQWSSDESAFTRSVKAAVDAKMGEFRKEWVRTVDNKFMADVMQHAATIFAKRAGLAG